jgi:gluconokinase
MTTNTIDSATNGRPLALIVMGVAGCGKSTVATACAQAMGWHLIEGDDYHSAEAVDKMRKGVALTDADREGWLAVLTDQVRQYAGKDEGVVLTCSALRRHYRDMLRAATPALRFLFLDIDQATAQARVAARPGHLFPPSLVSSQFVTLEDPTHEADVLRIDATWPLERVSAVTARWLRGIPDA